MFILLQLFIISSLIIPLSHKLNTNQKYKNIKYTSYSNRAYMHDYYNTCAFMHNFTSTNVGVFLLKICKMDYFLYFARLCTI